MRGEFLHSPITARGGNGRDYITKAALAVLQLEAPYTQLRKANLGHHKRRKTEPH